MARSRKKDKRKRREIGTQMQNPVPQIQKTGRFDETGVLGKIEQKK